MQSAETKSLRKKLDDESSESAEFSGSEKKGLLLRGDKLVFLNVQLLNLRV